MKMVLAAIPLVFWDFTVSDQGFSASGDLGQWSWGVPATGPGGTDAMWGTQIEGDYLNDAVEALELPVLDLGGMTRPVLVFRHWVSTQPGDVGVFEVDSGGGFVVAEPLYGYPDPEGFSGSQDWSEVGLDLSGMGDSPRVRLVFSSDLTLAAEGWYLASVGLYDGDVIPPNLFATEIPVDTQELDAPYGVNLLAVDDVAVTQVDLTYTVGGGAEQVVPAVDGGGGVWTAEIPAQGPDSDVTWFAAASDGLQSRRLPTVGTYDFRVFLAAPQALRGPEEDRVVAAEVTLDWDPPPSPHSVLSYRVSDGTLETEVTGLSATVPVEPAGSRIWTVRANYDVGVGDASEPLELDIEVPRFDGVEPASSYQGDSVRVTLQGHSLYLFQALTTVDFGAGIVVRDLHVSDVNALSAILEVSPTAEVGTRDVTLTGTQGSFTFSEVFQVRDGDAAPRVVSTRPDTALQGEELTVRVKASEPFAGPVTVVETEDVFVTKTWVEGDLATLDLVIHNSARLGEHTLVLDDGMRLWTTGVEVEERVFRGSTSCLGCATTGSAQAYWALLLLALVRRRR